MEDIMRESTVERNTTETKIKIGLNIDGSGRSNIDTGIGFFDHMLEGFAKHGLFDLNVKIDGDLKVDCHHSIEDCGIVLGQAIKEAVGDKKGIKRFGYFILPMDDALALVSIDLGGRPFLNFECDYSVEKCGDMETDMVREFFYAVSYSAMMNIHIKMLNGVNAHHMTEAIFKAFAKALDQATSFDDRIDGVASTKGVI
ncbi:MAG: imidazoleglycerol-phosphate dehydratase HisB [Lachnospiraceae bacterium]|nr:imidazoleglycerol-phosphate dehydratase HisB [Lachnospiraceae bacterium]